MLTAFDASQDRFDVTLDEQDWDSIRSHTAVAYILSPPIPQTEAEEISARALRLAARLLDEGGLAVKSESAGLAHGRSRWIELAHNYADAVERNDGHSAGAALLGAWVQRAIHDPDTATLYSIGMHLLGHPDTEVDIETDVRSALQWIDMMGLYLVADKPERPILDGEGFRLRDDGPRRTIQRTACDRYDDSEFFFNPYGYHRLVRCAAET